MRTCFTDAHTCVGLTCPVHTYALHPQKGNSKQDRTLFTGSHVHTSFSCVCLIHRRSNILQVKHHVNWFTSRSSIISSNEHISFTIADPVQTVPPMHNIFTNANPVHKFTSISHTHAQFNFSNVHIPQYDERHRVYHFYHGVAGWNPAGGEILPEPKRRFIAQSFSCSPFHRLEMTVILLKGRKTLTHPSTYHF